MTVKQRPKISTDMRKLKRLLKDIPEDRQPIANSLYTELVFMQNVLTSLKEQVENEGAVDLFRQGAQEFLREHPALKAYNVTIQRYSLIYKQLVDLLPPTVGEQKVDDLLDFVQGD